ncbi:hypothetical protein ACIRJO_41105 [Streptomyces sp. NPDC102394]|uniref:hypothetical protein n=1 Tax=Streptomyces sp. NPDC102394 TaxID=3366167 RepID=UPI00381465A1
MTGSLHDHSDFRGATFHGPVQEHGIQYNDYRTVTARAAEPDHAQLGVQALRIRDYRAAARHFGRAIEHDPERAAHRYYLSLAMLGGVHPCVLRADTVQLSLESLSRAFTVLPSCAYARQLQLALLTVPASAAPAPTAASPA